MLPGLFFSYLLMPLLALILGSLAVVLKRKNELINNKTLILFVLLASLIMALPGLFGFTGEAFSPWYYLTAQLIYLGLGVLFVQLYSYYFGVKITVWPGLFEGLVITLTLLLGGYLFALLFNLCSDAHTGGYSAATCMLSFPVPVLFYAAYLAFLRIPFEIYEVWHYPLGSEEISFEGLDFTKLMVLDLELSRQPADRDRMHVKAKAPAALPFGEWFKKFIDDYNYKFPNQPIGYLSGADEAAAWVFYTKRSFFYRRRMIDASRTVQENRIREDASVIAKRVFARSEEQFYKTSKQPILETI